MQKPNPLLEIAIIFLLITTATYAQSVQWKPIFASYASAGLNGIVQVGDSTLVAVGEYATIVRSTDLGKNSKNFTHKPLLNGASYLNSIAVTSAGNCIAVGNDGVVAISYDTAITWEINRHGTAKFKRIRFFGATGIIVGSNGVILKTKNDGVNWMSIESGTTTNLNDVHFSTANIISIVGDNGILLRSTDEGYTWKQDTILSTSNLTSICGDGNKMVISGDKAEMYRSSDTGATWTKVDSKALPLRSRALAMKGDTVIGVGYINDITEGQYFSFDAGSTWKQVPGSFYLNDQYIGLTTNKEFLICGWDSHISILRKGGAIADTSGSNLTGLGDFLCYSMEKSVIADVRSTSARNFSMFLSGKITKTTNGGLNYDTANFTPYIFSPQNTYMEAKQLFLNHNNEPVVRAEGKEGNKYMTTISIKQVGDTGWTHVLTGDSVPYYRNLDVNGKYCSLINGLGSKQIYLSSNGGKTWMERAVPGAVWNISVTASGTIWMICSDNNMYYLAKTWVEKDSLVAYSSATAHRIFVRDDAVYTYSSVSNNGFYDETMMYSSDSGTTWKTIFSQKSNVGATVSNIAIGKNTGSGVVAHTTRSAELRYTTDNGKRWETVPLPHTSSQTWVDCADDSTLLVSTQVTIWAASLKSEITSVVELLPIGNEITIYPNPATESFSIFCPDASSLTVRNVLGRIMYEEVGIINGKATIYSSNLASGVYFVEILAGSGNRHFGKVVVSH